MNFSITINGEGAELTSALKTLREIMDGKISGEGAVTATIQPPVAQQAATYPEPNPYATSMPPQQMFQPPVQQATPDQVAAAYQAPQSYTAPPQHQYAPSMQPVQPPVQQSFPPVPGVVPTTALSYSLDQLGVAAGPLVDAGRGADLLSWINQRGASALTQLDKAHYGEFANYLRSLGAKI